MSGTRSREPRRPQPGGGGLAPERQVQLPFRVACLIALQNIRVRLGRSMITAAGVLLGIALLSATLGQFLAAQNLPERATGLSEETLRLQEAEARIRQWWLVGMSLLVCAVGIANSMLMSVTERFKEIGTMKCLGALDGFIVRLFLLEAGVLGLLASCGGFLIGFSASVLGGLAQAGPAAVEQFPLFLGFTPRLDVVKCGLLSVGTGTLLTVLAAILPALQAARLPPAAALRAEI